MLGQEDVNRPPIRRKRSVVQHARDAALRRQGRGVPARPAVLVHGHEGEVGDARVGGAPADVAGGQDAGVEVGVAEDGAVLGVPGAAERAAAGEGRGDGGVGGEDPAVVGDVDAVLVGEGRVGALPGGDAAAAVAQRQRRVGDPGGAEAVEEVGLAGDDVVVEVGVSELADVELRCCE